MATVPAGTTFAIASVFAVNRTITAISNASEASVSSTAHGYTVGAIVEINSTNWGRLSPRIARVKTQTTDSWVAEGIDTTSTSFFPAGQGAGTSRAITTFAPIAQVLSVNASGGDPRQVPFRYMDTDFEGSLVDGFASVVYTLELDADSIGTPGYTALRQFSESQSITTLRMTSRAGALVYLPCRVAINESVRMQDGQINRVTAMFMGQGQITRYAS